MSAAVATWLVVGCADDGGSAGDSSTTESGSTEASGTGDDAGGSIGACQPGAIRSCYEGPPGTEGLGACAAGEQACAADGVTWSECVGQTVPQPAELCDTPQDDDCDGSAICEPTVEWWVPLDVGNGAFHVAMDPNGDAFVVSSTTTAEIDDESVNDLFLLKLGSYGQTLWARTVPETGGNVIPGEIVIDGAGSVTVAGYYEEAPDIGGGPLPFADVARGFIARFGNDGALEWSHTPPLTEVTAITVTPEGTIFALGHDVEPSFDGYPHESLVVIALDPAGQPLWTAEAWGIAGLFARNMDIEQGGNGELLVVVGLEPEGIVQPEFDGVPLDALSDSDYEFVTLRLGADGSLLEHGPLFDERTDSEDYGEILRRSDGGLFLLTGAYSPEQQDRQLVVQSLDADLEEASRFTIGSGARGSGAAVGARDTLVFAVSFTNSIDLGPVGAQVPSSDDAVAVAGVDELGQARWLELIHGSYVFVHSVATAPDGAVLLSATSPSSSLGGQAVTGRWLAKLRP